MACTFAIGVCVQGGQSGLNAFAAEYYPTTIRSTGVGWAFGVGRVGSIVAPLVGSWMLLLNWTHAQIFMAASLPMVVVGVAVLAVRVRHSRAAALAAPDSLPSAC
jgi:AAHS family 4-hydroxybenzoate transporter-like MFS transporter